MSQADVLDEITRVGWAIEPEPLTTLSADVEGTSTMLPLKDSSALSIGDTLVIVDGETTEFVWCCEATADRAVVVRAWTDQSDRAGSHAAGTPVHRLFIDYTPIIEGQWSAI